MPRDGREVDRLVDDYVERRIGRRAFFQRAGALGLSAGAASWLLAACGGGRSGDEESSSEAAPATSAAAPESSAAAPESSAAGETSAPAESSAAPESSAVDTSAIKQGGTLIEGYDRDFSKNDPILTTWDDPSWMAIYEFPMIRDAEGGMTPAIFESWEVSDDLLTWTFKMRPDLKFQSGAALDAAMMAENFNLMRDPEKGQNAIFWPSVADAKAGDDATTVVVTMKNPFTAFPETLATENSMPVNLRKREELGDDFGVTDADGSGPFTQTTYQPGTEVTVTKWADYPGSGTPWVNNKGPAYLDGIKWVPILEVGNRANEIETGGVNVVKNPAPQDVDRLKANPDLVITEFPALANYWIDLNNANTDLGFDDLRVRQALSAAIDREALAQSLYFGHAVATYGPIASNYKWYEPGVEQFNQFDVDKAKSLLEEAGWTEGSGGIREKNGKKLSWEHINNGGQPTTKAIDEAVVAMLKDVGAEMKVKSLDSAGWGEAVNNADSPPASYGFEWLWSSPVDLLIFFHAYPSDAYNGSIPEIKAAVEAWQTAATDADLEAAAKQFQLAWAEKLPKISLLTTNNIWVAQKSVMGYTPFESNLYPLYNDVWLDT